MKSSDDYQRGYRAAQERDRRNFAEALRLQVRDGALTARAMREIFETIFGVKAADDELGEDTEFAGLALA